MKLSKILNHINYSEPIGSTEKIVGGIEFDSRLVKPGFVFVAQLGLLSDGHKFIEKAIQNGATVVVCENPPTEITENVTYIKVADSNEILGKLASAFYDSPL